MPRKKRIRVPEEIHVIVDRDDHIKLRQRADALSKKYGFGVTKSDVVRKIIQNYLAVSG
jgi:predicted DNA-binding protein